MTHRTSVYSWHVIIIAWTSHQAILGLQQELSAADVVWETLMSVTAQTYHGTQHPGHIDGIPPGKAVLVSVCHKFGVFIKDLQANIQYSCFKL